MATRKRRSDNKKSSKTKLLKNLNIKTKATNIKTKKFKKMNCSPNKKLSFTCYSTKSLYKLKNLWNRKYPNKKILSKEPKVIWEKLKENLNSTCSNERCWLNQQFIKNNISKDFFDNTFAPQAPPTWKEDPNTWLNSVDINNVMKQYEKTYKNFKFIGPSPIDFDHKKLFGQCVWNELCNFDLQTYINKGITKIGVIFNTDPHYLGGAHWICLFINIDLNFIYYFDSNADRTPKEVSKFIKKVKSQAKNLGIELDEIVNKTEHQKKNTECGIYVLYVISELLKSNKYPNIFINRIPDKEMEKLRKVYFN